MRLATSQDSRLLVIEQENAIDVTAALGLENTGSGGPLLALLESGAQHRLTQLDLSELPLLPLADVQLAAPLPRPGKIVGAPVNYLDHKIEMSEQKTIAEYGVFLKANSSVIGPGDDIRLPYSDMRTDQEGELGIVIGRTARNVSAADALDYVFGYSPILDITVRSTEDRSTRKSFDTFSPMGPWITTADTAGNADALDLTCWVGGEERQRTNTRELIFSIADLVAYTSHVMTLHPGDVIASGTPAGVGPIVAGHRVVVEIEGLGRLDVGVSDEGAIRYADRPGATRNA
ncbi:fumarylacetoacetate hydrolase family protein [Microbacterium sp. STN6]|uniref:fumarylacetoacetate hydrolase family protein n=1 Tax=Microbacterium sp. STN6 TaxID=2995588 RepID=UPI002260ECE1|nr:fumarylacetoacetate hydrolase family protein [Microbacterium sp. STN6]MCX7523294.1 fumarylacetoacetate hydrolase family protein [Microbacterium sp. STN6]